MKEREREQHIEKILGPSVLIFKFQIYILDILYKISIAHHSNVFFIYIIFSIIFG